MAREAAQRRRDVQGRTTNGGVDVDLEEHVERRGVERGDLNGGVRLAIPAATTRTRDRTVNGHISIDFR